MEGGEVIELEPNTIGVCGGFAHVFRLTFRDDEGQLACVYLQRYLPGDGPAVGQKLYWEEGDTFLTEFVTDASGNRVRKFGEAFNKPFD